MVALAVRIARGLGLQVNGDIPDRVETIFTRELRRRLWCTICVLDLQVSLEQATQPLITIEESWSVLPRNVNDADFGAATVDGLQESEGLTDMTYALVTYNAQLSIRLLNSAVGEHSSGTDEGGETYNWDAQQAHVRRFETEALRLLRLCNGEGGAYAWFTLHGTQLLVASMRLLALRPACRAGSSHLLPASLDVLEKGHLLRTDARGDGFRWCATIPWHALATAITECSVCTDVALLRQIWPVIETSYQHYANYRGGRLRGPLEKIMRHSMRKVTALLSVDAVNGSNSSAASPRGGTWNGPSDTPVYLSPTLEESEVPAPPMTMALQQSGMAILDFNTFPLAEIPVALNLLPPPFAQIWHSPALPFPGQDATTPGTAVVGHNDPNVDWRIWDASVLDIPFDGISGEEGFQGSPFNGNVGSYQ